MVKRIAALLLIAVTLSGCALPQPVDLDTSSQEESAAPPVIAAPEVDLPAGYKDSGTGIGYKRLTTPPDCDYYSRCIQYDLVAYQACPSSVYVEANILDDDGTVIDFTNDTLAALTVGQRGLVTLGSMSADAAAFQLTEINCY